VTCLVSRNRCQEICHSALRSLVVRSTRHRLHRAQIVLPLIMATGLVISALLSPVSMRTVRVSDLASQRTWAFLEAQHADGSMVHTVVSIITLLSTEVHTMAQWWWTPNPAAKTTAAVHSIYRQSSDVTMATILILCIKTRKMEYFSHPSPPKTTTNNRPT
jgi:hypothetical protein